MTAAQSGGGGRSVAHTGASCLAQRLRRSRLRGPKAGAIRMAVGAVGAMMMAQAAAQSGGGGSVAHADASWLAPSLRRSLLRGPKVAMPAAGAQSAVGPRRLREWCHSRPQRGRSGWCDHLPCDLRLRTWDYCMIMKCEGGVLCTAVVQDDAGSMRQSQCADCSPAAALSERSPPGAPALTPLAAAPGATAAPSAAGAPARGAGEQLRARTTYRGVDSWWLTVPSCAPWC